MKTQILQLEPHDDIISARDKMIWGKTTRLLLVWPRKSRILTRRLDLILLQRRSVAIGAQLGLVTRDTRVRLNARMLGIPTFSSIEKAQKSTWHTVSLPVAKPSNRIQQNNLRDMGNVLHPNKRSWQMQPWARGILFLLGVLAVVTLAMFFYPSAEIHMIPTIQDQEVVISGSADPEVKSLNLSGNVPLHKVDISVSSSDQLMSSGKLSIPSQKAVGQVQFTNLGNEPITVPSGTIVSTITAPLIRFQTMKILQLSAESDLTGFTDIQALEAGSQGDVQAGSITGVEGPLGLIVSVTNTAVTTGGKDTYGPAPMPSDRQKLTERIMNQLKQDALRQMRLKLSDNDQLLADTLAIQGDLIVTSDPPEGEPGALLVMEINAEFSADYISGDDLVALTEAAMDANRPGNTTSIPGSIQIDPIRNVVIDKNGGLNFTISATRKIVKVIKESEVAELIRGVKPDRAVHMIQSNYQIKEQPHIVIKPRWWPWLPLLTFRMIVHMTD